MEYTTIVKPDGTIEVVPVEQTNNLPFDVGNRLFNQFNTVNTVPNITPFDPRSIFPYNVQKGITASSAAIPFEQDPIAIAQGFVKGSPSDASFPGANFQFLPSANEADETDVVEEKKRSGGLADLFKALFGFFVPGAGLLMGGGSRALEGIRSLNQRLRNTDFAKSKTLADYFDARKYGGRDERDAAAARNMAQARGIQKKIDRGDFDSTSSRPDRNRGSVTTASAAKSKGVGGGGYTKSDSTRDSYRGRY